MDGVHCRFHELKHATLAKDPELFTYKHTGPGLSYELALNLWKSELVWVNANDRTKDNDRANSVKHLRAMIPEGKKAVTDRGYRGRGGDPKVAAPNTWDPPELRTFKARGRMRQEAFHSRIKRFNCLTDSFRHSRSKHALCFETVCVLLQYEMELVSPLFDV